MDISDVIRDLNIWEDSDDGFDVTVSVADGLHVVFCDNRDGHVTFKVRNVPLPRIGSYVHASNGTDKVTVRVAGREYDTSGHIYVIDDGGRKYRWA